MGKEEIDPKTINITFTNNQHIIYKNTFRQPVKEKEDRNLTDNNIITMNNLMTFNENKNYNNTIYSGNEEEFDNVLTEIPIQGINSLTEASQDHYLTYSAIGNKEKSKIKLNNQNQNDDVYFYTNKAKVTNENPLNNLNPLLKNFKAKINPNDYVLNKNYCFTEFNSNDYYHEKSRDSKKHLSVKQANLITDEANQLKNTIEIRIQNIQKQSMISKASPVRYNSNIVTSGINSPTIFSQKNYEEKIANMNKIKNNSMNFNSQEENSIVKNLSKYKHLFGDTSKQGNFYNNKNENRKYSAINISIDNSKNINSINVDNPESSYLMKNLDKLVTVNSSINTNPLNSQMESRADSRADHEG